MGRVRHGPVLCGVLTIEGFGCTRWARYIYEPTGTAICGRHARGLTKSNLRRLRDRKGRLQ